ncbi:hypothetical protein SAMN05216345_11813 [Cupriavidus sp. YR651]|nr:hypothetical protein SAMN05216345_11813 [Cupriavidus sp. YR651]
MRWMSTSWTVAPRCGGSLPPAEGLAPPTSWQDLADPKHTNKVVLQSIPSSTFGLHGFLMLNRIKGGNESNVEPGLVWSNTSAVRISA